MSLKTDMEPSVTVNRFLLDRVFSCWRFKMFLRERYICKCSSTSLTESENKIYF